MFTFKDVVFQTKMLIGVLISFITKSPRALKFARFFHYKNLFFISFYTHEHIMQYLKLQTNFNFITIFSIYFLTFLPTTILQNVSPNSLWTRYKIENLGWSDQNIVVWEVKGEGLEMRELKHAYT